MMGKNNPALRSALFLLAVSSCVHFSEAQSSTTCTLAQVDLCDDLAACDAGTGCVCPPGTYGDGSECSTEAAIIRVSFQLTGAKEFDAETRQTLLLLASDLFANTSALPPHHATSFTYTARKNVVSMAIVYKDLNATAVAIQSLKAELMSGELTYENTTIFYDGSVPLHFDFSGGTYREGRLSVEPREYVWNTGTSSDPIPIAATGMQVDRVYFNPACKSSGCWVIDVTYTTGEDNFNVFYLPKSDNEDDLSFDFDYSGTALDQTYFPRNFPCGNSYDSANAQDSNGVIADTASACCIPKFKDLYRPVSTFELDTFGFGDPNLESLREICSSATPKNPPNMSVSNMPASHLDGVFSDTDEDGNRRFVVNMSEVIDTGVVDPYLGVYTASFVLDELETRKHFSKLYGVVAVEYSLDMFVGLANFKPANLQFIDMSATQIAIHLEKTNYFTVATHGSNEYTFLQYVNLRLIEIYKAGTSTVDVSEPQRFLRTANRTVTAQYVQVTFVMGEKYATKAAPYDIVPLDSVRVAKGSFATESTFNHACLDYYGSETYADFFPTPDAKVTFDNMLDQPCGPEASMCENPTEIPDSFVSFNIPLGFNWLPKEAQDLSSQVFVHLVIQTENTAALPGGEEEAPAASEITKTTLSASIPVVSGGRHIFCDALTVKTDLKDVANVVIAVGTAGLESELSRLRIIGETEASRITDTPLSPASTTEISSSSIESGLISLILQGNASYFQPSNNEASGDFGLELEDLFTIHIMESEKGFDKPGSAANRVFSLLRTPPDASLDAGQDRGDGYLLNGAFFVEILRDQNRARLQPSGALLLVCSWISGRPVFRTGTIPSTCILRRDVDGRNFYPKRGGQPATGMELPHCDPASGPSCGEVLPATSAAVGAGGEADDVEDFMAVVLGDTAYARNLGQQYAKILAKRFRLNNMANRGYWINPGYEWAAGLTGDQSKFMISQKIFLFALVALNENRRSVLNVVGGIEAGARRRVLLQAGPAGAEDEEEGPDAIAEQALEYESSPEQMIADAVGVPVANVVTFEVKIRLKTTQVCMPDLQLMGEFRTTLYPHFRTTSSKFETLQILHLLVEGPRGATCGEASSSDAGVRRSLSESASQRRGRALLQSNIGGAYSGAIATVRALVAFESVGPVINRKAFMNFPGIVAMEAVKGAEVTEDDTFKAPDPDDEDGEEGGGSKFKFQDPGLAAGGIGMGLVMAICVFSAIRMRKKNKEMIEIEEAKLEELEEGKKQRGEVGEEVGEGANMRNVIRSVGPGMDGKEKGGKGGKGGKKPTKAKGMDGVKTHLHGELALAQEDSD